jgi:hypothetical protein
MSQTASTDSSRKSWLATSPIARWLAGVTQGLSALRAPILVSIAVVIVLWLPEQIWEVYRVLVQQYAPAEAPELRWQWLLAVVALFALSVILWQIARELAHSASKRLDLNRLPPARFIFEWVPRVLATTPFVGAGLGLWYSWLPLSKPLVTTPPILRELIEIAASVQDKLAYLTVAAFVAALLVFLAITWMERRVLEAGPSLQLEATRGRRLSLINYWFVFPLIGFASIVAFSLLPINLPQRFGVLPIIALWATITTVIAAAGTRFCDATRIPIVTIAVLAVFAFELLTLSDNHKFRTLDGMPKVKRTEVDEAFKQWITSRGDLDAYRGKNPYPVYIVAAEGGGLYAAYHTAKVLARLQDMCENFAQHVFAVSSVSGGSFGAAVFAALAQGGRARNGEYKRCDETYTRKPDGFEVNAEKVLTPDFLSPLAWAGLFPDFAQRFLPVRIYALDRATALEKSFEDAWRRQPSDPGLFTNSFFALCSPGSTQCAPRDVASPALLLNATNVETGMQMVLSPMYLGYTYVSKVGKVEDFYRSDEMRQLPLSTAVGLSARFPWVLPVGWHEFMTTSASGETRNYRMSFVDGGYYDASGVATAENLAQYLLWYLRDSPDKPNLGDIVPAINIIMITGSYQPVEKFFETKQEVLSSGEVAAPLTAFWQSWRARGAALPIETAADRGKGPYVAKSAQFDNYYLPLPLGWQLGKLSRLYLDLFSGRPENCGKALEPNLDPDTRAALLSMSGNDCLVKKVIEDLQPNGPATAARRY